MAGTNHVSWTSQAAIGSGSTHETSHPWGWPDRPSADSEEAASRSFLSVDKRRRPIEIALQLEDADKLFQAISAAREDQEVLQSLPDSTYTQIFNLLDPDYMIEPEKKIHRTLTEWHLNKMKIATIGEKFGHFLEVVHRVAKAKRMSGRALTLPEYTYLLRCARATGDGRMADVLWRDMRRDGVLPDLTCYNHYLASKCWFGMFNEKQVNRARVVPYNQAMRQVRFGKGWLAVKVGPRGVKDKCITIFERLTEQGLSGNEETFTLMMMAMGREGDMSGAKAILNGVWNIDADGLAEKGEESLEPVAFLSDQSELRPTERLLYTIAYIFGINNDIPGALRLVDYVSRQYSTPVGHIVWQELLEWTYVLSAYRRGKAHRDGSTEGQLSRHSMRDLWSVMTSEPYCVKPDMPMYDKYMRTLDWLAYWPEFDKRLAEGLKMYSQNASKVGQARLRLKAFQSADHEAEDGITRHGISLERAEREVQQLEMIDRRDRLFLKRWIKFAVRARRADISWERRALPDLILVARHFFPTPIKYDMRTGTASLDYFTPSRHVKRGHRSSDSRPSSRTEVTEEQEQTLSPTRPVMLEV
ncbi:MAG: hypothetical protein M1825_003454 [Sarcosagium campestre]|nr:MAG: hypothetical protein M1825_003454 [Sarcosagium campestre]